MKKQSSRFLSPVNQEEIIKFKSEVKENLVPDYKKNERHILSTADLWNIQRNKRVMRQRRFL